MKKIYVLLLALGISIAGFGQNTTLATIATQNVEGPSNAVAAPGLSAVGFSRGDGLIIDSETNTNVFSSKEFTTGGDLNDARVNNDYIEWSFSADAITNATFSQLDIQLRRNPNGPNTFQIVYSLDNFDSELGFFGQQEFDPGSDVIFEFSPTSPISLGASGTITFRLYAWGAASENGNLRIRGNNDWDGGLNIDSPGARILGTVEEQPQGSSESDIIAKTNPFFPVKENINYLEYLQASDLTPSNALLLGIFTVRDGGESGSDNDELPTTLNSITFNVRNSENIAALAIINAQADNVAETTTVGETTTFTGLDISAEDNGTQDFYVYATFKQKVKDNKRIQVTVSEVVAPSSGSSGFSESNAGGAKTSNNGDDNRIEVTANRFQFNKQPQDGNEMEALSPAPKLVAVDINSNKDLDFNSDITVTTNTSSSINEVTYQMEKGKVFLDNVVFNSPEINIQLVVSGGGLSVTSNPFNIDGFDGLVYSDAEGWRNNRLPDETTGDEDARIIDGTYDVENNAKLNNLIIEESANVFIDFGKSLEVNTLDNVGNIELTSISNNYSSLIVNTSITNPVVYNRHVNSIADTNTTTGKNDFVSAPVTDTAQTFLQFRTENVNVLPTSNSGPTTRFFFGPFDNNTGDYLTNTAADDNSLISAGTGYRTASKVGSNALFKFTGNVEIGSIAVPVTVGAATDFNLIGNPYPSYIRLDEFLQANQSSFSSASAGVYGYIGDFTDGFKVWNTAYSEANPDAVIAPGQGFIVSSTAGGASIKFNPNMRSSGTSDDFISGRIGNNAELANITLQLTNGEDLFNTDIYFNNNASLGMDKGYDSGMFNSNNTDFSMYSHLVENNTGIKMAAQAVSYSDLDNVSIPLGINADQGQQLTINISSSNIPDGVDVFLEDNVTNTFTNLITSDYTISPSTALTGTGRFYVHVSRETLGTSENILTGLDIFTSRSTQEIIIKGLLKSDTQLSLYDAQGRTVVSKTLDVNEANHSVNVSTLAPGIYIVQLTANTMNRTQKVIIR